MHPTLVLLRKDFLHFRRDRGTVIMTFLVPLTMIYLFGQIYGVHGPSPTATQLVGGWAMQFLLFALVWSANSLFQEKELGLFQRILAGPVPRAAILASKFLYGTGLGLLQLGILFAAGHFLFGIALLPHLPQLVLVGVGAAAACSAFGMLLASLANNAEMARGLYTFCILLMSALGGAWFPVSYMPPFMQQWSRLTLVYWAIHGFQAVFSASAGWSGLLPTVGILFALAAGLLAIAWWRFERSTIFA
jgi:ABC-type multidrug transport system permease subunit